MEKKVKEFFDDENMDISILPDPTKDSYVGEQTYKKGKDGEITQAFRDKYEGRTPDE
jgi:hypothetical protein